MIIKLTILIQLNLLILSCSQLQDESDRITLGESHAKSQIREALKDSATRIPFHGFIKDKETAIAMVEPILFKLYGQKRIVEERPYEVYFVDDYWYIAGTLPKGYKGGTFEAIISANDGKILRLMHYK